MSFTPAYVHSYKKKRQTLDSSRLARIRGAFRQDLQDEQDRTIL
jgi:hypothetical protein